MWSDDRYVYIYIICVQSSAERSMHLGMWSDNRYAYMYVHISSKTGMWSDDRYVYIYIVYKVALNALCI